MKQQTLREVLTARKIRISELARRSGVDKGTVSRLAAGVTTNPSSSTVAKIETALKIRRGSLVFGEVAA
jgi:transcriptional regulator with XRE-family HTH domain